MRSIRILDLNAIAVANGQTGYIPEEVGYRTQDVSIQSHIW